MTTSTPLISIVMPAYNAQTYIVEAIESVIVQSYVHWELIIIDDGSTDSTLSLVEVFNDERIVVKSQKNAGVSAARNVGISLSKGVYITFLDADDVLPQQSLGVRIAYLEGHSDIDLVDGQILVKDTDMNDTLRTYTPYYEGKLLPRLLALDSHVFFNVCYMFRKDILGTVRFKEEMAHAEDLLFYIELSGQHNVMYGFVNTEIYHYRSGHDSAMTNLSGLEEGYIRLLNEVKKNTYIYKMPYLLLKLKIMKIMFLSWMNKYKIWNAFFSIHKILWL